MNTDQILKINRMLQQADENGFGEIARNLSALYKKGKFTAWINGEYNYWEFRLPNPENSGGQYNLAALVVFPTSIEGVLISLKPDNIALFYSRFPDEYQNFLSQVQSRLREVENPQNDGWLYYRLTEVEQTNWFIELFSRLPV